MTIDHLATVRIAASTLGAGGHASVSGETIALAAVSLGWLTAILEGEAGPGPDDLDAVCRQIDVRKRLSAAYRSGWKRVDDEAPAGAGVVSAVAASLLWVAAQGADRGRDLKLVNSALKALELAGADAHSDGNGVVPALRAWAVELLDQATIGDEG